MARSTFDIKLAVASANKQLALPYSNYVTIEYKMGIIALIENILMDSGAYEGYTFINPSDSEFGTHGYFNRIYITK